MWTLEFGTSMFRQASAEARAICCRTRQLLFLTSSSPLPIDTCMYVSLSHSGYIVWVEKKFCRVTCIQWYMDQVLLFYRHDNSSVAADLVAAKEPEHCWILGFTYNRNVTINVLAVWTWHDFGYMLALIYLNIESKTFVGKLEFQTTGQYIKFIVYTVICINVFVFLNNNCEDYLVLS